MNEIPQSPKSKKEKEPEIGIFRAASEDMEGMRDVFYYTWLATYPNEEKGITVDDIEDRFKDAFTKEFLAKKSEQIANLPENETRLVAKEGEKIVGLCHIIKHSDNNQLQAIYILPEYQGKGIGMLLWKEAQKVFDPTKDTIVQVATYNANAIDFYKRLGFVETEKCWEDEKLKMKSGAIIPQMEMIIKA